MASATLMLSFSLRLPSSFSSPSSVRVPNEVVQFSPFSRACSLKLSSSRNISGFAPILPLRHSTLNSPSPSQPSSLTVVSAKGYKMKTHKVCTSVSPSLMQFGGFGCTAICLVAGKRSQILMSFYSFPFLSPAFSQQSNGAILFLLVLCSFVLRRL